MKNRKFLLIVSLVLAMTMSLGGTLAYLTDSDGDVNVMTVGRVEIKQNEQDSDGNAFEQDQQMLPIVGGLDKDTNGYPQNPNYIDKIVTVTNTGNTDAWVRTLIAFPELTHNSYNFADASTEVIHWNGYSFGDTADKYPAAVRLPGSGKAVSNNWWWGTEDKAAWPGNTNDWNIVTGVEIGGLPYTVYIATNVAKVASEETTAPNMVGIYMDSRVDYNHEEECYTWGNDDNYITFNNTAKTKLNAENVKVYVLSQAVQASGFDTAWEAFDAAFPLTGSDGDKTEQEVVGGWFATMTKDTVGENNVPPVYISTEAELATALSKGGTVVLTGDIQGAGESSYEVAEGVTLNLDLNGHTITNQASGKAALINNGTLTLANGSIVNGTDNPKASHTIVNNGTLTINSGNYGTFGTAGAAVVNYGTVEINGGTFASKQENTKGDGLCAYAFINQSGTMTINNATLNGQTHGLFGAYDGTIIVNGGNYTLDGNDGLGCYVVYATGDGKVELNGGVIHTNSPRSNRVFFVYDNGNNFNAAAVETGKVAVNGATIYLNGVEQTY